ncbi:MAG: CPBP family intramembrane metalloprotease [Bacteroidales bacterium]|nr:CPBP family intramembrane metalloprotease [Bacteroidales bacterium]
MFKLKNLKYFVPNLADSWVIVVFLLIVGSVAGAVAGAVMKLNFISYFFTVLVPVLWIFWKSKIESRNPARKERVLEEPHFGHFGKWTFFGLLLLIVPAMAVVLEPLSAWIPMPDFVKQLFEKAFDTSRPVDLFIAASILAPIFEEFICRGTICRGLLAYKSPAKAILWSAFIFAVIHANPWQAIPAFVIGCLLGWVYYRTHSLLACVFIHFANNTFAQLMGVALGDPAADATLMDYLSTPIYIALLALCAAVVVGVIFLLNKNLDRYDETLSTEIHPEA